MCSPWDQSVLLRSLPTAALEAVPRRAISSLHGLGHD